MLFAFLVIIISIYYIDILTFIQKVLRQYHFSSRSIDRLLNGSVMIDRGRDNISSVMKMAITEKPITGYGLFGDRYLTAINLNSKGTYAHNIFLEILVQFGIPLGSILIGAYLYNCIRFLFYKVDIKSHTLYLCAFSATFIKLMFSNSFWLDTNFYFLFAVMIIIWNIIRNNKKHKDKACKMYGRN